MNRNKTKRNEKKEISTKNGKFQLSELIIFSINFEFSSFSTNPPIISFFQRVGRNYSSRIHLNEMRKNIVVNTVHWLKITEECEKTFLSLKINDSH